MEHQVIESRYEKDQ